MQVRSASPYLHLLINAKKGIVHTARTMRWIFNEICGKRSGNVFLEDDDLTVNLCAA